MENIPLFSIIIPTYNRASFITKSIQSVLIQKYRNFEIIVVDDGSKDKTEKVVKEIKDQRIKYFKKDNAERGAARNFGMRHAAGDYITFLDSDDVYYSDYLYNALETLIKYDFPKFFHLNYEVITSDGKVLSQGKPIENNDLKLLAKGNPFSCLGVFIHNEVAKQYRFTEDRELAGSEDWELWVRIAARYGFITDNRISAALINHELRSVLNYNEQKLFKRKILSISYMFKDPIVKEKFGKYFHLINSYSDTYISLHLVLSQKNLSAIKYLVLGVKNYPPCIFERRFLAIIKHLLLNIFKA